MISSPLIAHKTYVFIWIRAYMYMNNALLNNKHHTQTQCSQKTEHTLAINI